MKKSFISLTFASILGGLISLGVYQYFQKDSYVSFADKQNIRFVNQIDTVNHGYTPLNFTYGANIVRPCVVHVKNKMKVNANQGRQFGNNESDQFFKYFFGDPGNIDPRNGQGLEPQAPEASGSGVIISEDGYIVTNNHVIDNADLVEIVLDDKRKFEAKIIGKDPETDLALLKIDQKGLPFAKFGNSDKIQVGEWVLACGNPFELTSTVTAGIVSAKGRNLNLLRTKENYAIESFIQTDAAVNPGNSGGALVNLKGELIGINTAIASPNGSFAGYSFAVPVSIVKKVMDDLLNFGEVQRALIGIMIQDVTAEIAKEKNIKVIKGVYVNGVNEGGAAKDAGIKQGDVICKIDNLEVNSSSELQETVAQHRPGEKITVNILRDNKPMNVVVTLKNKKGNTNIVKQASVQINEDLGAELSNLTDSEKTKMKVDNGIKVTNITNGKLKEAGVKDGFVITKIDKQSVSDVKSLTEILKSKTGGILIEGVYANGNKGYYALGW